MASGQGWGGHSHGANNEIYRRAQRRRVIMFPANSHRNIIRGMRSAEATITMLLEKSLNSKVNINQTHIDLRTLRVVIPQANKNAATYHQREN